MGGPTQSNADPDVSIRTAERVHARFNAASPPPEDHAQTLRLVAHRAVDLRGSYAR